MYAIVEIAGHQYKVEKDQQIFVNRLAEDEGAKVKFDEVLFDRQRWKSNSWRPGYQRCSDHC